ncbi:MAG TPA: GNAT family N-acetyltransferase [Chloroflexota bacterium]
MPPIIREFHPADYKGVAALWQASEIRVDTLEELELKLRRDPDLFLVAEEEGRLVGVVLGAFDGRLGSINRLAVAEASRRAGLARQLVAAVEQRLRAKGARRVFAWIHDYNTASRALFARQGFEEWTSIVTASKSLVEGYSRTTPSRASRYCVND